MNGLSSSLLEEFRCCRGGPELHDGCVGGENVEEGESPLLESLPPKGQGAILSKIDSTQVRGGRTLDLVL